METDQIIKPQDIYSREQFEKMADEMLMKWKKYKKLESRMKLLYVSTMKYMVDNEMEFYETTYGALTIPDERVSKKRVRSTTGG